MKSNMMNSSTDKSDFQSTSDRQIDIVPGTDEAPSARRGVLNPPMRSNASSPLTTPERDMPPVESISPAVPPLRFGPTQDREIPSMDQIISGLGNFLTISDLLGDDVLTYSAEQTVYREYFDFKQKFLDERLSNVLQHLTDEISRMTDLTKPETTRKVRGLGTLILTDIFSTLNALRGGIRLDLETKIYLNKVKDHLAMRAVLSSADIKMIDCIKLNTVWHLLGLACVPLALEIEKAIQSHFGNPDRQIFVQLALVLDNLKKKGFVRFGRGNPYPQPTDGDGLMGKLVKPLFIPPFERFDERRARRDFEKEMDELNEIGVLDQTIEHLPILRSWAFPDDDPMQPLDVSEIINEDQMMSLFSNMSKASEDLPEVVEKLNSTIGNLEETSGVLKERIGATMDGVDDAVKQFTPRAVVDEIVNKVVGSTQKAYESMVSGLSFIWKMVSEHWDVIGCAIFAIIGHQLSTIFPSKYTKFLSYAIDALAVIYATVKGVTNYFKLDYKETIVGRYVKRFLEGNHTFERLSDVGELKLLIDDDESFERLVKIYLPKPHLMRSFIYFIRKVLSEAPFEVNNEDQATDGFSAFVEPLTLMYLGMGVNVSEKSTIMKAIKEFPLITAGAQKVCEAIRNFIDIILSGLHKYTGIEALDPLKGKDKDFDDFRVKVETLVASIAAGTIYINHFTLVEIDGLINDAKELLARFVKSKNNHLVYAMNRMVDELQKASTMIRTKMSIQDGDRPQPITIVLLGKSGTGKTTLASFAMAAVTHYVFNSEGRLADLEQFNIKPSDYIFKDSDDVNGWMDGYSMKVLHLLVEDAGRAIATDFETNVWGRLNRLGEGVPVLTPQADVGRKGNVYMTHQFVWVTTNSRQIDTKGIGNITSYRRRVQLAYEVENVGDFDAYEMGASGAPVDLNHIRITPMRVSANGEFQACGRQICVPQLINAICFEYEKAKRWFRDSRPALRAFADQYANMKLVPRRNLTGFHEQMKLEKMEYSLDDAICAVQAQNLILFGDVRDEDFVGHQLWPPSQSDKFARDLYQEKEKRKEGTHHPAEWFHDTNYSVNENHALIEYSPILDEGVEDIDSADIEFNVDLPYYATCVRVTQKPADLVQNGKNGVTADIKLGAYFVNDMEFTGLIYQASSDATIDVNGDKWGFQLKNPTELRIMVGFKRYPILMTEFKVPIVLIKGINQWMVDTIVGNRAHSTFLQFKDDPEGYILGLYARMFGHAINDDDPKMNGLERISHLYFNNPDLLPWCKKMAEELPSLIKAMAIKGISLTRKQTVNLVSKLPKLPVLGIGEGIRKTYEDVMASVSSVGSKLYMMAKKARDFVVDNWHFILGAMGGLAALAGLAFKAKELFLGDDIDDDPPDLVDDDNDDQDSGGQKQKYKGSRGKTKRHVRMQHAKYAITNENEGVIASLCDDMVDLARKNTLPMFFDGVFIGYMLCTNDRSAITLHHYKKAFEKRTALMAEQGNPAPQWTFRIGAAEFSLNDMRIRLEQPHRDLLFFDYLQGPAQRDIRKHFATDSEMNRAFADTYTEVVLVGKDERIVVDGFENVLGPRPYKTTNSHLSDRVPVKNQDGAVEERRFMISYRLTTRKGACGLPLLVNNKIMGIHSCGNGSFGHAARVTRDNIVVAQFSDDDTDEVDVKAVLDALPELGPLSGLSVDNGLPYPFEVHNGDIEAVLPKSSVFVKEDEVPFVGFGCSFPPTEMKPVVVTPNMYGVAREPYNRPLPWTMKENRLEIASMSLGKHYADLARGKDMRTRNLREAIEGDDVINSYQTDTSPGWPYSAKGERVRDYFWKDEQGKFHYTEKAPGLFRQIDMEERMMREGITPEMPFSEMLKYELRKESKQFSPREIQAANMNHSILGRKYMFGFLRMIHKTKHENTTLIGVDPVKDWDQMESMFRKFPNHGAGDFGKWDALLQSKIVLAWWNSMEYAFGEDGYHSGTERGIANGTFRRTWLLSCVKSVHVRGGIKEYWDDSWCSGNVMTACANSGFNNLVFLAAWIDLCAEHFGRDSDVDLWNYADFFWMNTVVRFLGDDNRFSVSDDFKFFNMKNLQGTFLKMGLLYTDAQKSPVVPEFEPVECCTLLKRISIWHEDIGRFEGASELPSMIKMLHWTIKNKEWEVIVQKAHNFERELASQTEETWKDLHPKMVEWMGPKHVPLFRSYSEARSRVAAEAIW